MSMACATAHLPEGGDNKDWQIDLGTEKGKGMTSKGAEIRGLRPGLRQAGLLLRNTFTQARCKEPENTPPGSAGGEWGVSGRRFLGAWKSSGPHALSL